MPNPFASRRRGVAIGLGVGLSVAVVVTLCLGAVIIAPAEVSAVFLGRLLPTIGRTPSALAEAVLWNIRLPRALMGVVGGGALAVAGVVLQGVFRNPLADPQLLGIGAGASLGAVMGSAAGATQGAIAGGAAAGMLTALVVRRLGRRGAQQPSRFILTGVALSAALTAWVGFVVFGGDRTRIPPMEFWLLGSLAGSTWRGVGTTAVLVSLGLAGLFSGARSLDLLALGESEARHLGVDVDLVMTMLLLGVGVVTGATVGAVGVIGFVGLLIPHLIRILTGPAHRPLMFASLLGGGLFVVLADLASRTVAIPIEIPVGLVTAVLGGPFLLWLIRRVGRV